MAYYFPIQVIYGVAYRWGSFLCIKFSIYGLSYIYIFSPDL